MSVRRVLTSFLAAVALFTASVAPAQMTGDYNDNGELDAPDLDLQAWHIAAGICLLEFDLNADNLCDFEDRLIWVHDLRNTWVGDANLDGEFNSGDLVQVFVAGKYEAGVEAGWQEGDFNGNMLCGSGDFVWPGLEGYEKGSLTFRVWAASVIDPVLVLAWEIRRQCEACFSSE